MFREKIGKGNNSSLFYNSVEVHTDIQKTNRELGILILTCDSSDLCDEIMETTSFLYLSALSDKLIWKTLCGNILGTSSTSMAILVSHSSSVKIVKIDSSENSSLLQNVLCIFLKYRPHLHNTTANK